jgi:hypothetical protein
MLPSRLSTSSTKKVKAPDSLTCNLSATAAVGVTAAAVVTRTAAAAAVTAAAVTAVMAATAVGVASALVSAALVSVWVGGAAVVAAAAAPTRDIGAGGTAIESGAPTSTRGRDRGRTDYVEAGDVALLGRASCRHGLRWAALSQQCRQNASMRLEPRFIKLQRHCGRPSSADAHWGQSWSIDLMRSRLA